MSNVHELEIDGMKPSELKALTKKNWVPFVAFMLFIAGIILFTIKLATVAADVGEKVMPRVEYGDEK